MYYMSIIASIYLANLHIVYNQHTFNHASLHASDVREHTSVKNYTLFVTNSIVTSDYTST